MGLDFGLFRRPRAMGLSLPLLLSSDDDFSSTPLVLGLLLFASVSDPACFPCKRSSTTAELDTVGLKRLCKGGE